MTTQDRLLDLLAALETEGLGQEESGELELLLAEQSEFEADDFGLAAAEAHLEIQRNAGALEAMPESLRRKIRREANGHLSRSDAEPAPKAEVVPFERPGTQERGPFTLRYAGWYAAAAMLLLALWASWDGTPDHPISILPQPPTTASQRATLIEQADDVIQVAWGPSELEEYAGVTGDVVWSPSRQAGFLRLIGLPANTPSEKQYQLWIVDPSRDEHPIDGGVFDVPGGFGEVIVPIDAKLTVEDATAFAITLERTGGVVVSAGPLLVVAPV